MKVFILSLVFLSFLIANCAVQSRAGDVFVPNVRPTPTVEALKDEELPFSPFEIRKLIENKKRVDISALWERIGLDADVFTSVSEFEFDAATVLIDGDNLNDSVLNVWSGVLAKSRLVLLRRQAVFNLPQDEWKLIGYVDIADQQYGPSEYQIVNGKPMKWLVVKELTGRGTGVSTYEDRWYEIKPGALKSLLNYVSRGHDINNQLGDRTFSAKMTAFNDKEIAVEYTVEWTSIFFEELPDYKDAISQSKKAYYTWDNLKGQFVYNKSKSEISEQEIEEVYSFDTINDDLYFKYTFPNLKEIAEKGTPEQKKWLALVLDKLVDSSQKRQLQTLLEQNKLTIGN